MSFIGITSRKTEVHALLIGSSRNPYIHQHYRTAFMCYYSHYALNARSNLKFKMFFLSFIHKFLDFCTLRSHNIELYLSWNLMKSPVYSTASSTLQWIFLFKHPSLGSFYFDFPHPWLYKLPFLHNFRIILCSRNITSGAQSTALLQIDNLFISFLTLDVVYDSSIAAVY